MKKRLCVMAIVLSLSATGCGFVSQEKYDSLDNKLASTEKELDKTEKKLEKLQKKYDSCKEKLNEYEETEEAESNAQASIPDSATSSTQVPTDTSDYETGITYDQLARTPNDYEGNLVKFTGEVVQVMDDTENNEVSIRLAVDGDYDNILFCGYSSDIVTSRVLENDTITIYGVSYGLYSYESALGGQITIPAVWIDRIDQ